MDLLKKHGEKFAFVGVALLCGGFIYTQLPESTDEVDATAKQNIEKIKRSMSKAEVTDAYPYSAASREKNLNFSEQFNANMTRPVQAQKVPVELGNWVAYPQPVRPGSELESPIPVEEYFAELAEITDFNIEVGQGRVFLRYRVPTAKQMKYMEPVKVEILRGTAEDKLSVIHTDVVGVEDPSVKPAPAAAGTKPAAATAAPGSNDLLSEAARRRAERSASGASATPIRGRTPVKEPPNPYAGMNAFIDNGVEEKTSYIYKVRFVARMTKAPDVEEPVKDTAGVVIARKFYRAPKNGTKVPSSTNNAAVHLFATPPSKALSVTTPANFQLRMAGVIGEISPNEELEQRKNKDYQGQFAVKIWVPENQEFMNDSLTLKVGDKVKGSYTVRPKAGGPSITRNYDLGYTLSEVKWGETVRTTVRKQKILGADGRPVLDENGAEKFEEIEVAGPKIPIKVAVLKNKDGKLEEFPERTEFDKKVDPAKYYEMLRQEQEAARAAREKDLEAVRERVKAYDEAQKAPATNP